MTTKRLPYFKFFPADFLGGVTWLTNEQIGVYIQLLCVEWESGPLPSNIEAVERRVPGVVLAWPALQSKFVQTEDGWINERLESERKAVSKTSRAYSERGKKGAKAMHAKRLGKHASSMQQACNEQSLSMTRAFDSVSVSDSVSGSGFESGESVRGVPLNAVDEAIAELDASNGASLAFTLSRDPDISSVWNAIPKKFATEWSSNLARIESAIRTIMAQTKETRQQAAATLAASIVAYCNSDLGKTEYRGKLATFLDNGRFFDDAEAWKRGGSSWVDEMIAEETARDAGKGQRR